MAVLNVNRVATRSVSNFKENQRIKEKLMDRRDFLKFSALATTFGGWTTTFRGYTDSDDFQIVCINIITQYQIDLSNTMEIGSLQTYESIENDIQHIVSIRYEDKKGSVKIEKWQGINPVWTDSDIAYLSEKTQAKIIDQCLYFCPEPHSCFHYKISLNKKIATEQYVTTNTKNAFFS